MARKSKTYNLIKKDLLDQLEAQNKFGQYYKDLVEDYMYNFELKNILQKDIDENGLRVHRVTGNGFETEKPNESVERLMKVNTQMLKLLQDLNLQIPQVTNSGGDDNEYC